MRTEAAIAHVADDMERIFAPLAGRPLPAPPLTAGHARRRMRAAVVLPALAAVAGGGALAVVYGLNAVPPVQAPYRPVDRPITAHSLVLNSEVTPRNPVQVAAVAPSSTPSASVSPAPVPRASPSPAIPFPAIASRSKPEPAADVGQTRDTDPTVSGCEPGSPEDHCIYRDVMSADARLRRAYERAADAGVSPWWLASVGRRWERARDDSSDNPDRAIARYNRLADALDGERDALQ